MLNKYLRTLLHTVTSEFLPMAEEIIGKPIGEVVPLIDHKAGWAMIFFRADQNKIKMEGK